ncbi:ImmA/IrrE family metallo-endopeptidase [Paucilactobacillus sp. N302-9]
MSDETEHYELVRQNANNIIFHVNWNANIDSKNITWREVANLYRDKNYIKFKGYEFANATKNSISGSMRTKNGRSIIGYNTTLPLVRQHFTLMHELYHYQVHSKQGATGEHFSDLIANQGYDEAENVREIEANIGAGMLMINESAIRYWINDKKLTFNSICKKFGISHGALYYRLLRYNQFECGNEFNSAINKVRAYQTMNPFQIEKSFKGFY